MGSGTVGDSIRNEPANSASPAASAPQPANSDDLSGDSISVTGGVPGTPPSAAASDTNGSGSQAQPSVATAPAEAPPSAPAVAIAPAPAEAPPSVAAVPVTAADVAPAAAPSIATTTTAPEAVAPESMPVTTAATAPPAGAIAPPMTLAPVSADVPAAEPPTFAASAPAAATPPASATAPAEAVAPHKAHKASGGETKLASNAPQQGGAFGGMQFGNNKAPIDIKSKSMSLDYQNHSVLWVGDVHATQADAQLTSDQLRVNYLDKDFKQMKDMVADGNVRLSQGTRWATGKHGVMDQTNHTVVLTGSPVAHDGNDQITGCKITVYLNTSQSVVDCAHAVLFPHSEASPGAGAAPAAATD
ncbi:LptA/OstA family protein [Candidatus Binatus sp.]|uniref:LptA/OstA family protein n=1 Tax=Candidatus Binatus sp. TaxID=2811406 RepID=UPI002F91DDCD